MKTVRRAKAFSGRRAVLWGVGLLLGGFCLCQAQPLQRVPNTTLAMPSAPPTLGYAATNAFGTLTFVNPVAIASPPGETNRVFIVEKNGTIQVITNLAAPNKTLFLNISNRVTSTEVNTGGNGEQGLLGMAFHPGYATNRYFFLFYTGPATTAAGTGRHDILARLQTSPSNPNQAPTNEVRLLAQFDQDSNHDGGDIQFGPDGYLYVPLGDEGAGNDTRENSQRINKDFFAGILRIDVDKRPGNLTPNPHASIIAPGNYSVPADNPFVGATSFNGAAVNPAQVRGELWAVGLRNPWRIAFDPLTGELYCADVGQSIREEVSLITKGGNYGWNYWEGFLQRTNPTPGGFTHAAPLLDYAHTAGRVCIIGGVVSRGARLSQLYGAYLYAEYATGEIWYLRQTNGVLTQSNLLFNAGSGERIATFGTDPSNGDVLYAAHLTTGFATSAQIKRIIYNTVTNGAPLPPTLAAAGVFANLTNLTPHAGIVPYEINVPFWSDNAIKSRWFSVPNTNLTVGFNPNSNWSFPTGTVWVKHFELELTNGVPASRQRLETRLLVKNNAGTYGVSYRWGNSTTNATLVSEAGLDEAFVINDGGGILRTQVWRYPSWVECQACHTGEGGFGLGFNTPQLNHDFNYGSGLTNQILALSQAGYFNTSVTNASGLLALAPATNSSASLEHRVRSYLTANCVYCHQPGGSAQQANWDARITTPTAHAGLIYGALTDDFGNASNRVITPLSLTNSMLHTRINMRGARQMPPLASALVDTQNVALVAQWIGSLSNTFWLGATPQPVTVTAGNAVNISVNVLPMNGFTNQVALSVSGIPYGVHAAFTPATIGSAETSTLRLTTSAATPAGNYLLTLSGAGGGASSTTTVILNVAPFASSYLFEAEDLQFVPTGATSAIQFDALSSAGEWQALQADGVGDYIDYTIPLLPAGNYHFKMMYKAHPNRGILSLTLGGNLVTNALDQYSAATAYPDLSFGNRTLATSGAHVIRQTVVGRNVAAGAFTLSADRFTFEGLTPPQPPPPVVNQAALQASHLVISGDTGVTNGVYYVLSSSDLTLPRSAWTVVATNLFDASGNFDFSIPIQPSATQRFYLLKLP